MTRSRTPL